MFIGDRRLSAAERADFKSGVNWPQIFTSLRIKAKRSAGGKFITLCQFHTEKTASCRYWPERQQFFCHGCKSQGDMVDFVARFYELREDDFIVANFFASLPTLPLPGQLELIPLPGHQLPLPMPTEKP